MADVSSIRTNGSGTRPDDTSERAAREVRDGLLAAAGVEHQLKTAVSIIQGWAETLERNWDNMADSDRLNAVSIVKQRATALHHECERLIEAARRDVDDLGERPEVTDLRALLGPLITALDGMNESHTVELRASGPVEARVQSHVLEQVVSHLVENAVKHSRAGSIVVSLEGRRNTADIAVVDDGPGLPDGIEIFAPFEHGGLPMGARQPDGAGFGLYVVSRLVAAMGGTLSASGNPSGGATFRVRLPR